MEKHTEPGTVVGGNLHVENMVVRTVGKILFEMDVINPE